MKIKTQKGVLLRLDAIPWSAKMFNILLQLEVICPNLRLDAVEIHTGKPIRVALFQLNLEWIDCKQYNA